MGGRGGGQGKGREGRGKYLSGYRSTNNLKTWKRTEAAAGKPLGKEEKEQEDVKVREEVTVLSKPEESRDVNNVNDKMNISW